jgi:hypothetical protein
VLEDTRDVGPSCNAAKKFWEVQNRHGQSGKPREEAAKKLTRGREGGNSETSRTHTTDIANNIRVKTR